MYNIILFLHVFSAVAIGFYLLFPLLATRLATNQEGLTGGLLFLNRTGQYILIISFLTGGYMISQVDVSVTWMIVAIILVLVMFAMTGMISKPLKRLFEKTGGDTASDIGKVKTFSIINSLSLSALIIIMLFRNLI